MIFFPSREANRDNELLIRRIARARDETRSRRSGKILVVVRGPTINLRKWNWVNTTLAPKRAKCLPTDSCTHQRRDVLEDAV